MSKKSGRRGKKLWSFQAKLITWVFCVSTLPVLAWSVTIYRWNTQSINKHLNSNELITRTKQADIRQELEQELLILLTGSGVIALLVGTSSAFLTHRSLRPLKQTAVKSHTLVNRLLRKEFSLSHRMAGQDELTLLESNINLVSKTVPDLLWQKELEAERLQVLKNISEYLRAAFSEQDVFRITVEETRQAFRADRITIFRFDANWNGTFVDESVAPGWPRALWATIKDPCFEGDYADKYKQGRVSAIENIYEANLTDCHIGLLERFAVKANLIAPIIKNKKLFGLLIAHQCSRPRIWQQVEMNLFAQIAIQTGLAIENIERIEQLEQAYQKFEAACQQQIRQNELIQQQVLEILSNVKMVFKAIAEDSPSQMELVTQAYNSLKNLANEARQLFLSARQLDLDLTNIPSLVEEIQIESQLSNGHANHQVSNGYANQLIPRLEETQAQIKQITAISSQIDQISPLVDKIAQDACEQAKNANCASESILEVARITRQTSEQTHSLLDLFDKLEIINQKLQKNTQQFKLLSRRKYDDKG